MTLRVALVGGPMYDGLYQLFEPGEVEVVVHADHPTLNREVAALLAAGERIDVLCTHSKYAPSQAEWLLPIDGLVDGRAIAALAPAAVDLCRFRDELLCVPRNIDVRVLWVRSDRSAAAPSTWSELEQSPLVLGFPGRESGLFGMFFELVRAAGGQIFDADARPTVQSAEAVAAVETLVRLADRAPAELPTWHYDQVDAALVEGSVDAAAAWPGGFGRIRSSRFYDRLDVHPYPGGPGGRFSYSGCHAFAIPKTCRDVEAAAALIERLVSVEGGTLEARSGAVPANVDAFAAVVPVDDADARRLEVTRETIANAMITYPPLARFPEVEDQGWIAINQALRHELTPEVCVEVVQRAAERALEG